MPSRGPAVAMVSGRPVAGHRKHACGTWYRGENGRMGKTEILFKCANNLEDLKETKEEEKQRPSIKDQRSRGRDRC